MSEEESKECKHEVIYGGLCAVCGVHVDVVSTESSTAHINMSHRNTGVTVSRSEAKRIEQEDEKRLVLERKLSLIVDLDQTILHATWEPSIAEWVKERKAKNSPIVKDIRQFTLDGSPLVYSIKLRPGLHNFLREISRKYEMHIYTMGTRSYAEAVVREIDPDGTLFQDRILSRDENGSMTEKRLERLFPSDTSRVLVLDDRADVWNYSNNLIQIKPYEYFIGIGDINSPFAQPKTDIIPSADELSQSTTNSAINTTTSTTDNVNNTTTATAVDNNESSESSVTTTKTHVNGASNNDQNDTVDNEESSTTNGEVKEQNGVVSTSESKEDSVDEKENKEEAKDDIYSDDEDDDSDSKTPRPPSIGLSISNNSLDSIATKKRKGKEKEQITPNAISSNSNTEHDSATHLPNTHDTDDILRVIRRVLLDVHNVYFNDHDRGARPDVAIILNSLKARVFRGVNVVFSGVIPINTKTIAANSWIWRMATSFGAECLTELLGKVTHLIAVNPGTHKVHSARRHGNIRIISPAWITDSAWNWERQNESKYLLPLAELSPAESEVENPESASLDYEENLESTSLDYEETHDSALLGYNENPEKPPIDDDAWELADAEVNEAMAEDSDDDEGYDESDAFDSEIASTTQGEGSNSQSELTSIQNNFRLTNGVENRDNDDVDSDGIDDDFLGADMDAMLNSDSDENDDFEYSDVEDDMEYGGSDHGEIISGKRTRDESDNDLDEYDERPSKKSTLCK